VARAPLHRTLNWTLAWDSMLLVGLWTIGTQLRIWLREFWTIDLIAGDAVLETVEWSTHAPFTLPILVCWLYWMGRMGAYRNITTLSLSRLCAASTLAFCSLLALLFSVRATDELSRSLIFTFALVSPPVLWWGRRLLLYLQSREVLPAPTLRILLIGNSDQLSSLRASLENPGTPGLMVIDGDLPHPDPSQPESCRQLRKVLDEEVIDHVFVGAGWSESSLQLVARSCEEVGLPFSVDANFLGLHRSQPDLLDLGTHRVLSFSTTPAAHALGIKRVMDLVVGSLLLMMSLPLMGLIFITIRISDGRPAFFIQTRVGQNGRLFKFYKFRTMVVNAERQIQALSHSNDVSGPVFKMKRDPRVTPVGRFLRKSSLDELPQLWNVLRGEMSLVGPRPPIPSEVARYERWQLRRLSMKPGLTCIWQVSGRSEVDFERWMRQDLEYIDNWSLSLDLKLLVRTVPAVLSGSGAH
jgi:exopolysaccharide biosynthesis polyprenyl glycosylphosphotransferase